MSEKKETPAEAKNKPATTAPAVIEENATIHLSAFGDKKAFEEIQRQAMLLTKSTIVPEKFQNNVANCVIALEISTRLKMSPISIMQGLFIIKGNIGWYATFLISLVNTCGRFSKLRYKEDELEGGRTMAYCTDLETGDILEGDWVSVKLAKEEGWFEKSGSKWKTMPKQMRRYRSATFWVRVYAPEFIMGMKTEDEIQDIGYTDVTQKNLPPFMKDAKKAIEDEEISHTEALFGGKGTGGDKPPVRTTTESAATTDPVKLDPATKFDTSKKAKGTVIPEGSGDNVPPEIIRSKGTAAVNVTPVDKIQQGKDLKNKAASVKADDAAEEKPKGNFGFPSEPPIERKGTGNLGFS